MTSHGHTHPLVAGSAAARHFGRMAAAFGLVLAFFADELLFGILSLISDARHMAADVVALGAALVATKIATRPDRTGRRSYGSYRTEVFASGLTVLIMLAVSVYVVVEAISRIGKDVAVRTGVMVVVGGLGLLINIASILLLRSGSKASLNVRGAYFEVVSDAAGSIGVIVARLLIALTGNPIWDTLVVAIGIFVAFRAVVPGRKVLAALGQHVPEGVDLDQVVQDLEALNGVDGVHDIHIWNLTSGMNVATAHLVVASPQ